MFKVTKKRVGVAIGFVLSTYIATSIGQQILDPIFSFLGEGILNLSTFGLSRLKDSIYIDIAKNFHENTTIEIYLLLVASFVGFATSPFTLRQLMGVVFHKHDETEPKKITVLLRKAFSHKVFYLICLFYVLVVSMLLISMLARERYVNSAVTHYNQLLRIVTPYVSQQDIAYFNSRYAQIRNRKDYTRIIDELKNIAEKNNSVIPKIDLIF